MRTKRQVIIAQVIASILIMAFLTPVLYTILSSFKGMAELFSTTPTFFPKQWTLANYIHVLSQGNYLRYILNSLIVATTSTIIAIVINTMSGYALAKFKFKGSTVIMIIILSTIMLPLEIFMAPIFKIITFFGMYDSLWAIIIPPAATPTGIFLMRQYLLTIPDDIICSARIDGASEWKIFTKIIIPNAKPAIATLAIFSFMWRWNDYIWPLISIFSPEKYTLQLAIANLTGEFGTDYTSALAISVFSMIPMLIIFILFQKQFVQGTVESGMKG
ncbi:MAG: carbohydrate ABC transporter permease [Acholeplasma sp.]|jgi:alpha-1,4-digalacturonate transport system permease protein|nr:MAG: carbohydrate ABC transporter permease [Acholeplasma sp.]